MFVDNTVDYGWTTELVITSTSPRKARKIAEEKENEKKLTTKSNEDHFEGISLRHDGEL